MINSAWALALTLPLLAACGPQPSSVRATVLDRQLALDPPQLWRVEALSADGSAQDAVRLCADTPLMQGFAHPTPAIDGARCVFERQVVRTSQGYVQRCELFGRRYSVHVGVAGDRRSDFTVRMAMLPLQADHAGVAQTLRYRRLGPCPAGWKIGDTDKPGHGPRPNALS
ncbi:MAG TPA: hypothetical protein VIO94_11775 [Phenylobacterium sp.]